MLYEVITYLTESINWHSVFVDTKINPVKAIFNLLFSKLPYNAERFISKSFAEKLKKLLQSNNYDIVQLEGLYLTPYTNIIKEYSVAKISMRSHNIEHKIWERMAQKESNILKAFYNVITSYSIHYTKLYENNKCSNRHYKPCRNYFIK